MKLNIQFAIYNLQSSLKRVCVEANRIDQQTDEQYAHQEQREGGQRAQGDPAPRHAQQNQSNNVDDERHYQQSNGLGILLDAHIGQIHERAGVHQPVDQAPANEANHEIKNFLITSRVNLARELHGASFE